MSISIAAIQDSRVRVFYSLYWPQHQIIVDFFAALPEDSYDYYMVNRPQRKSSTPRKSLAHILNVQDMYLDAAKSKRLVFESKGLEVYKTMTKGDLIDRLHAIDDDMFHYLNSQEFDSSSTTVVPWGQPMNTVDVLFFLRDHDILHIGWNLAYMDHLDVPRFESLKRYWGP